MHLQNKLFLVAINVLVKTYFFSLLRSIYQHIAKTACALEFENVPGHRQKGDHNTVLLLLLCCGQTKGSL